MDEYYYKTAAFKRHLIALCGSKKYLRNPFGRIRSFPTGDAPAAVDFWCQSTVADCLWNILLDVAIAADALGGRLVTTVYDSVLIQVPQRNTYRAEIVIKEIMERKFDVVAPGFYIPVDVEYGDAGKSWGELRKRKELVA
jgi:DNA polymerase I-like protein with 3'-5' exonuclease and polymerase domains